MFSATVAIAKNPDGSSITGPNTEEFVIDTGTTPASQRLTYPAASAEKSKASLTVRRNYADTPIPVPATDWDYVDAKLNAVKLTSGNFGAKKGNLWRTRCSRFLCLVPTTFMAWVRATSQQFTIARR